ncbi:unnamed protein product [Mytilus edulis]|uniref:Uncharacterized protein n=1 Tax=Mytilus edulis TaxID=6550 RepID=A0A8S3R3Q9_MYTED|nr:unnamed protein product [Mytilus edulis]
MKLQLGFHTQIKRKNYTERLDNNPFDCSTCDVKELKDFLQRKRNAGAKCEGELTLLIYHTFDNCKELTTEHREETSTVSQKQTTLIITIAESETTESFQSSAGTDTPASTSESTSGIINTEVIIYLSCGVGFILLLSFSMACFYVGKKYQNNPNLGINQIVDTNNRGTELDSDAQRSPTVSTGSGSGYGYAEIDELELSEFILTPPEQLHIEQDDTSSDSYDRISPPSNDYLNPYQSLLPSLQQSGNDHNNSDEYSHPDEENTAYTNLYQPIRFNRLDEFRQYASCSSVHYFEVLDDPIENTNDVNMQEDSKRRRKTW